MKRTKIFICIYLSLVLFSCSKKSDDNDSGSTSSIKMQIGEVGWEADKGIVIGTSIVDGKHNLTVTGANQNFNGETSSFSLIFSQSAEIGAGNYTLNSVSDGMATLTKVNGKTYLVGQGVTDIGLSLEITEVSGTGNTKKFRGRFQGQLKGPTSADRIGVTGQFASF